MSKRKTKRQPTPPLKTVSDHVREAIKFKKWIEEALQELHDCRDVSTSKSKIRFSNSEGESTVRNWPNDSMFLSLVSALEEARRQAIKTFLINQRIYHVSNIADAISEGYVTVEDVQRS